MPETHGFRRTDQTNADKLPIKAATDISFGGSRTKIMSDSEPFLCSLFVPYMQ
jgi:hypothetical protein